MTSHISQDEFEGLEALLGVTITPTGRAPKSLSCGAKAPKVKARFTQWNNFHSFEFGGYVARVERLVCGCCERVTDVLEGIFVEEVHLPTGTRRMTQMAQGADWPAQGEHRKEVVQRGVPFCGGCVGDLGFSKEVDGKGEPWALMIKEG